MHLASVGFRQGTWCHWQGLCPAVDLPLNSNLYSLSANSNRCYNYYISCQLTFQSLGRVFHISL